jgi:hypothetical protein
VVSCSDLLRGEFVILETQRLLHHIERGIGFEVTLFVPSSPDGSTQPGLNKYSSETQHSMRDSLEEGITEDHVVDLFSRRVVQEEEDRKVDLFARPDLLLFEAEAFDLGKVGRDLVRRS